MLIGEIDNNRNLPGRFSLQDHKKDFRTVNNHPGPQGSRAGQTATTYSSLTSMPCPRRSMSRTESMDGVNHPPKNHLNNILFDML